MKSPARNLLSVPRFGLAFLISPGLLGRITEGRGGRRRMGGGGDGAVAGRGQTPLPPSAAAAAARQVRHDLQKSHFLLSLSLSVSYVTAQFATRVRVRLEGDAGPSTFFLQRL